MHVPNSRWVTEVKAQGLPKVGNLMVDHLHIKLGLHRAIPIANPEKLHPQMTKENFPILEP